VVDDGMAAETQLVAALRIARARKPALLVLALPAATPATTARLRTMADAVYICKAPRTPGRYRKLTKNSSR